MTRPAPRAPEEAEMTTSETREQLKACLLDCTRATWVPPMPVRLAALVSAIEAHVAAMIEERVAGQRDEPIDPCADCGHARGLHDESGCGAPNDGDECDCDGFEEEAESAGTSYAEQAADVRAARPGDAAHAEQKASRQAVVAPPDPDVADGPDVWLSRADIDLRRMGDRKGCRATNAVLYAPGEGVHYVPATKLAAAERRAEDRIRALLGGAKGGRE